MAQPCPARAPVRPNIIPFDYDGTPVRVVRREGEPWFVLADVCRVLEIGNASMASNRLDDDERGISTVDTPSDAQEMIIPRSPQNPKIFWSNGSKIIRNMITNITPSIGNLIP